MRREEIQRWHAGLPEWLITIPWDPIAKRPKARTSEILSTDDSLAAWWSVWEGRPVALGVPTGVNQLVVLDLDRHGEDQDGIKNLLLWLVSSAGGGMTKEEAERTVLDHPVCWWTGGGGIQLAYRRPDDWDLKGLRSTTADSSTGIDTRGSGFDGVAILPPSKKADGRPYRWVKSEWERLPEAPGWLLRLILSRGASKQREGRERPHGASRAVPVGRLSSETVLTSSDATHGTARELLKGNPTADKIAVHCPVHDDRDPSAVIFRPRARGCIRLYCSSCGRTWSVGRLVTKGKGQ